MLFGVCDKCGVPHGKNSCPKADESLRPSTNIGAAKDGDPRSPGTQDSHDSLVEPPTTSEDKKEKESYTGFKSIFTPAECTDLILAAYKVQENSDCVSFLGKVETIVVSHLFSQSETERLLKL